MSERLTGGTGPGGAPAERFRQVAADSPHLDDELLAERLEIALRSGPDAGRPLVLSEIIDAIPLLRSRPISLDTAIDGAARWLLLEGLDPSEVERRLIADAPGLRTEIQAHMALRSMLKTTQSRGRPTGQLRRTALPAPFGPSLPNGQQRFELVEYIGGGSDGSVYLGYDRQIAADGRPLAVAVKILHASAAIAGERVSAEAARVMRIRHPAVTSLLDWGVDPDGTPYLAYEYTDGVALHDWRRSQDGPSQVIAAQLVARIAEGVQAAHNAGVVHRDLKPNNILIVSKDQPVVTDFGLAAALQDRADESPGGSLAFAAPEQLRGEPGAADGAVDVYALGGLLFWLLTGEYPNGSNVQEAQQHIMAGGDGPRFATRKVSSRRRTLEQICLKALAPAPSDRFGSPGLLASDLQRWLAHEPVLPFERSSGRQLALAARRSPGTVLAIGGVMLAALAVLWAAWRLDVKQKESEFAIERERLEQSLATKQALMEKDRRRIEEARSLVQEFKRVSSKYISSSGDTSWLAMFGALEALSGRGVLSVPSVGEQLVKDRARLVTSILEQAETEGKRDSAEMAMWETALVFWLLKDGANEEAQAAGLENTARLAELLPAEDPWVITANALHRIAELRVDPDRAGAADSRAWLEEHRSALPDAVQEMLQS